MARFANPEKEKRTENEPNKNNALALALQKRDRFLKQNPHMVPYQEEIDRILDGAGSSENRLAALGIMIESKLGELQENLAQLSDILPSEASQVH